MATLRETDYQNFGKFAVIPVGGSSGLSRMGSEYYRTLQNGGRQAAAAAGSSDVPWQKLNSQLTEIRGSAVGMAGAFAGAFATGHLISLADEWSYRECPSETGVAVI